MFAEIAERSENQYHEKLQKLSKEDTKWEEEKSIKMWEKQQVWFTNYEKKL